MDKNFSKIASEVIRFSLVGGIATLLHYVVYLLFLQWLTTSVSYTIGYGVGFIWNYNMSAVFTFKKKRTVMNGIAFLLTNLFNYLLQMGLLSLFLFVGVRKDLLPIPVYALAIPINFIMVRLVFNRL